MTEMLDPAWTPEAGYAHALRLLERLEAPPLVEAAGGGADTAGSAGLELGGEGSASVAECRALTSSRRAHLVVNRDSRTEEPREAGRFGDRTSPPPLAASRLGHRRDLRRTPDLSHLSLPRSGREV
jgi:hypothetical protein